MITIINGINNEQVGRIVQFALDNPKKIPFLSFQPVSFTGRDEAVTDERRAAQRYTLSHLAHDVKNQTGLGEPARDWFPISFMSTFSDWSDLVHGPQADWGQLSCGCHPNCGVGMAVMVDKETKEARPVTAFLNADQLAQRRGPHQRCGPRQVALDHRDGAGLGAQLRSLPGAHALPLRDLLKKFDKTFGATGKSYGKVGKDRTMEDIESRRRDRWNFLFIAGMWFQDLFNYDFRRTEQCIIPYATQEGEISFCAYNTGVGWRNIIEKMHMTATLTKWYEEHGKHEIFAGGKQCSASGAGPLAGAARRDRHQRRAARSRPPGHRQERARREDPRPRREAQAAAGERAHGEALPPARAEGAARSRISCRSAERRRLRLSPPKRNARKSVASAINLPLRLPCHKPPVWRTSGPAVLFDSGQGGTHRELDGAR